MGTIFQTFWKNPIFSKICDIYDFGLHWQGCKNPMPNLSDRKVHGRQEEFFCWVVCWQVRIWGWFLKKRKSLTGIPSMSIWIRSNILSGLIWVQYVWKGYQQTPLADTELEIKIPRFLLLTVYRWKVYVYRHADYWRLASHSPDSQDMPGTRTTAMTEKKNNNSKYSEGTLHSSSQMENNHSKIAIKMTTNFLNSFYYFSICQQLS